MKYYSLNGQYIKELKYNLSILIRNNQISTIKTNTIPLHRWHQVEESVVNEAFEKAIENQKKQYYEI